MKTTIDKFSAHKFKSLKDINFSLDCYSKFKHGNLNCATLMGKILAESFFKKSNFTTLIKNRNIAVTECAYSFIPSAASLLTTTFINHLNVLLEKENLPKAERFKMNRTISYTHDYGKMSLKDRESFIQAEAFTIDDKFLENKFIIVLDDVYISGTHHKKVEETFLKYSIPLENIICCYFCEMINDKIDPSIENDLNTFIIKDFESFVKMYFAEPVEFIVRAVRLILRCNNSINLNKFLSSLSNKKLFELYCICLGEGYHNIEEFKSNVHLIKNYAL